VGLRAVLDAVVKRKIPSPRRESNPRTPNVQPVAQSCGSARNTTLYRQQKGQYNGRIDRAKCVDERTNWWRSKETDRYAR
jgi:hypothetical protein